MHAYKINRKYFSEQIIRNKKAIQKEEDNVFFFNEIETCNLCQSK
jgi:hypothetical protein